MYDALHEARHKWRLIGRKLGVDRSILDNIEAEHSSKGNERCLEELVSTFLKRQNSNPTWQVVIDALKHKVVGEEVLAEEIERRYGEADGKEGDHKAVKPLVESTPTCECMTH